MLPDQGCYEERYRLTGSVAWGLALPLLLLVPAVLGSQPVGWLILSLVGFALVTLPSVLAVASRRTAFRADQAGITLGATSPRCSSPGPMWRGSSCTGDRLPAVLRSRTARASASSAARAPRHCPGATSPPAAARCLA